MTDGHVMVLSLMATALFASVISRLLSAPLYPSLAILQLKNLKPVQTEEAAPAVVETPAPEPVEQPPQQAQP